MVSKVLKTISRYRMLQQGDSVLAAVSGGADSTALLDCLCELRGEWGLSIAVCHVNHSLRGAESDRDEALVRQMCRKYGVKLFCFTENILEYAEKMGQSVEEAAREVRYQRMKEAAEAFGPGTRIATAHTLSDSMETALFHLARGTGPAGLCGIPPVRGEIIRPLIEITRREVEQYCEERGLQTVTDSTNLTDAYTRNRIRHHVIPRLYEVNPAADAAYLRLTEILRNEQDYLDVQARELLRRAEREDGWDTETLSAAHPALLRHALVLLLKERGFSVSYEWIQRMTDAIRKGEHASWELSFKRFCETDGSRLRMIWAEKEENPEWEYPIADGTSIQIGDRIISFLYADYEDYKKTENYKKTHLKNAVDYDKIRNQAIVRTRRAGDRFSLPGRNWTKTLKKLMNEEKIPREQRSRRLVCADEKGVFWVEGFGADKRAAVDEGTKRLLLICMLKLEDAVNE